MNRLREIKEQKNKLYTTLLVEIKNQTLNKNIELNGGKTVKKEIKGEQNETSEVLNLRNAMVNSFSLMNSCKK